MATLYTHQAPIRVGLVPVAKPDDEAGSLLAQVFYKLVEEKDGAEAVSLLSGVSGCNETIVFAQTSRSKRDTYCYYTGWGQLLNFVLGNLPHHTAAFLYLACSVALL